MGTDMQAVLSAIEPDLRELGQHLGSPEARSLAAAGGQITTES